MPNDNAQKDPIRVLIADDDPIMRSLIAARVQLLNGIAVEAEDGSAAWELQTTQQIDLAIIDLNMPNIDGFTLIRCMRNHLRTRHVPIIVVTSMNDAASINSAFEAGASSFLMKPLNWSTFQHHIGFLLRLVQDARQARVSSQKANADAQAKESILGSLCTEVGAAACNMLEDIDELSRLVSSKVAPDRAMDLVDRLRKEAAVVADNAARAARSVDVIFDRIAVDDRKEVLDVMIDDALRAVAVDSEQAGVDVVTTLPPEQVLLSCDAQAVSMAIVELLRNAITHSRPGTQVDLSAKVYPDGLLAVDVTDHGAGIPPDRLARSLTPMRVNREVLQGTGRIGFGLPFAKAIAEAHSGKLELKSMHGVGTSALLIFPPDRVSLQVAAA